jgi:precorrin-2 dehydrogenase/sirohydrochlorin ferrochelatase
MFVKLEGRTCLVVGAGAIGEQKIKSLLGTGARVRVVSLTATNAVLDWAAAGVIDLELRPFADDDLEHIFLAIVATQSRELNQHIYREAERRGILCNVVDVPDLCDFYYGAVVRRGDLQIAISTAGQSPTLAQRIRIRLEQDFGPEYSEWVAELGATRKLVLASALAPARKRELLSSLAPRQTVESVLQEHRNTTTKGSTA